MYIKNKSLTILLKAHILLMTCLSVIQIHTVNIEWFMNESLELIRVGTVLGDWHPGYDPEQGIYITIRYNITHKNDLLTLIKYKYGEKMNSGNFLYKAILHKKDANQIINDSQYPKELSLLFKEAYQHCTNLIT